MESFIKLQAQRLCFTIFCCFKQNRIISLFMSFCRATLNAGCYTNDKLFCFTKKHNKTLHCSELLNRRPSHSTHSPLSDTCSCDIKFFNVHFPFSGNRKAWLIINVLIANTVEPDRHRRVAILWA